jgi:hypothetical protein
MRVELIQEGATLTCVKTQLERPMILDTLAEMRKAAPMRDQEGLGRWALSVPMEDWLALRERFPDLQSKDQQTKTRAWLRIVNDPEFSYLRVRDARPARVWGGPTRAES